jgi:asparagine synthase (glutamine-hydrolysing)
MCGICGTTRAGDGRGLALMNQMMRYRGPDDEGIYVDPMTDVGLGVRRLSIIDVAGGHQPMSNEDGSVWAVLNGEIYNHRLVRDQLLSRGHQFKTKSDTEVLVHAYEDFGDDLVHALEGMFAIAIWDGRRRRLLLARDRFGEKPIFYADQGGVLTFASELTAVCAGARITREISIEAMDAFFILGYVPGPETVVRGVKQVPPGHLLTWDLASRSLSMSQYWAPLPMPSAGRQSFHELVEETACLLEASMRSRMISDVPVGVFLSGGVDSTLVTALAARNSSAPIKTYTVGYDVGGMNEIEPARRVAHALGTDHHEFILTQDDVAVRVPAVLAALDQPIADEALVALHVLSEGARRDVKVAVGGEGADELFGGYPRYRWLARSSQLQHALPATVLSGASSFLEKAPISGRARRLHEVLKPDSSLGRYLSWVTSDRLGARHRVYGGRLRSQLGSNKPWLGLVSRYEPGLDGDVAAMMRMDQNLWLPDDVLAKADRASMLASLEMRTPYLDRRLAEFAFRIPAAVHYRGRGKSLLRAVLKQVLPDYGTRPKTAFRVPSAKWLAAPLAASLAQQVTRGYLYEDGWFDRAAVARLAEEHRAGRHDWSSTLWPILSAGLWMDRFMGAS